jgi:hypothetical protein
MQSAAGPVWIDPAWLSWESYWDTKDPVPNDGTIRLYEIHQHACDRLASDPSEFDRIDAIMTLRRVIARRVKALKETYQLRELPIGAKPKYDLELLESFGIIRPFMLRRLIEIRNIVEHQDSSPPPVDECLMFADLVWYFLRSTDGLARMQVETLIFKSDGMTSRVFQKVMLHFGEAFSEPPKISSLLHAHLIINEPKENWIKIEPVELDRLESHGDFWISISGKVCGTEEQMRLIYDTYFRISHLGGLCR